MPRRKMKLGEKVRVFFVWLRKYGNTSLLLTCGRCDSVDIQLIKSTDERVSDEVSHYKAEYYCRSCHALGVSSQTWSDFKNEQLFS